MVFGSLFLVLDDTASVLDDVALMTKTAAAKTAGVLGDDLALSARQLSALAAEREWPVVWAVARGSLLNKAILVSVALALSALAPALVVPLLMAGGVYLCLEGVEKLAHRWLPHEAADDAAPRGAAAADEAAASKPDAARPLADLAALERDRVKGAIRTDLLLSAEIIVIALGSVAAEPLLTQVLVLVGVALLITIGVYGLVAGIVKIDDLGLWLAQRGRRVPRRIGLALLQAAPMLMKLLTWIGTAAMFFVGGGILLHGLPALHGRLAHALAPLDPASHGPLLALAGAIVVAGSLALGALPLLRRLRAGR